jgi:acyl carrier protein
MESKRQDSAADQAFLRDFEELLELPSGSLEGSTLLQDLPGWDSLAIVGFMAMADEKYGVVLSPRQFQTCNSLQDLAALVTGQ